MLAIKNNLMAENAARQLGKSYDALAKSVERLSSGLRINSAKDDAAGLAVRELIREDVAALHQGSRNARDAISMLQAAEGGLSMIDEILVRMRELAEQAATDTYSSTQKTIMQQEFTELSSEVTRIANTTDFNGHNLLKSDNPDSKTIALGSGLGATDVITIDTHNMQASGLGTTATGSTVTSKMWALDANTNYIKENNVAAATLTLTFKDGDGNDVAVDIAFAKNEGKSLNTIVNEINSSYSSEVVASAVYSAAVGQWTLKVTNKETGVTGVPTVASSATLSDLKWAQVTGTPGLATTDFDDQDGSGTGVTLDAVDISTNPSDAIDNAIKEKDEFRAHLGYMMNRLEAATSVLDIQAENLMTAESRVSDVDVATEMARFTRNQVLAQAGISMLAQANTMPQMALQLLS